MSDEEKSAVSRVEYLLHELKDCEWLPRFEGSQQAQVIEERILDIVRKAENPLGGPSYLTISGDYPLDKICVNANGKNCAKCFEDCELAVRDLEARAKEEG